MLPSWYFCCELRTVRVDYGSSLLSTILQSCHGELQLVQIDSKVDEASGPPDRRQSKEKLQVECAVTSLIMLCRGGQSFRLRLAKQKPTEMSPREIEAHMSRSRFL
jgi:hypothetical protein